MIGCQTMTRAFKSDVMRSYFSVKKAKNLRLNQMTQSMTARYSLVVVVIRRQLGAVPSGLAVGYVQR